MRPADRHPCPGRRLTEMYRRGVYRFLLTRQWVILTLVCLLLMPTMVELGLWQLHRHERQAADNDLISRSLAAPPVPVEKLTAPRAQVAARDDFRAVTVTGHYDPAHQVVVRRRTSADDSQLGYYLVTPLVMADGRAVLVNRGWIPMPADGGSVSFPPVPPTPAGEITVTGRIRQDETTAGTSIADKTGLPPRQIMLINSGKLVSALPEPLLGGYVQLSSTSPRPSGDQPQPVPPPKPGQADTGGGWYSPPHLAYAWQWWLFTAMIPVGWFILVRRERRDRLAARAEERSPGRTPETAEATTTAGAAE